MSFNYSTIFEKSPCFVLVKNLRYKNDNPQNPIERGEIIRFSEDLTSLMAELNRPKLEFDSKTKIKYFLYSMGFYSDLQQFEGDDLIQQIDKKTLSEIDAEIHEELSNDAILNILFENKKLKEWEIMYDFGGSAYQQNNKPRDYQFFDETYDIRFFGGKNQTVMFEFIAAYFEKNRYGNDIDLLLTEIRFDFFEMMDAHNGKTKIHPYDLWHSFLNFLYKEDLINESTLVEYAQDTYF
jgi:hypothetical protein